MYRGSSFTDAFTTVKEKLDMPIMLTEFGADSFNAIENAEDQKMQAYYMVSNWKDIYPKCSRLREIRKCNWRISHFSLVMVGGNLDKQKI